MTDWRLPENRREMFQRFYTFHLTYRTHPGCVYFALPAIAEALDLDEDQKAWLVWLNGNTQNPAMSLLLLEAAPRPEDWKLAVDFWNANFKLMDWDTDRRHQKSKFGEATEIWATHHLLLGEGPAESWRSFGATWTGTWAYARSQPFMGRLSAWSMTEYARILLGNDVVPDADNWLLNDVSGSRSHRNGIAVVKGYDAWNWDAEAPKLLGIVDELEEFADELLDEARLRNVVEWDCGACEGVGCDHCRGIGQWGAEHPDVGRLTMESALCTYKSWHKPNRRYPNVYADMMHDRLRKAESRFGKRFDVLWEARREALPEYLRLEDSPHDPGLTPLKQNFYLETGMPVMMHKDWPDLANPFNDRIDLGLSGLREPGLQIGLKR